MCKKILSIYLIFIFQISMFAKENKKEIVESFSAISLSLLVQDTDTILKEKYLEVKKEFKAGNYSNSLKLGLALLPELREKKNKELEYLCNFLIGDIFRRINNHDKSISHFKTALQIIESRRGSSLDRKIKYYNKVYNRQEQIARLKLRIGGEYHLLGEKNKAKVYYNQIVNMSSFNNNVSSIKASAFSNLAGINLKDSLYDIAKDYSHKAVEIYRKNNKTVFESAALINLASIHLELKEYSKAKEIYYKALGLIKNNNSSNAIRYKEDLYYNLAWTLYLLKDYTAYDYQEMSYGIKDSLRNAEMQRIVEDIYAKYKEEYKIETLKSQTKLKKAEEQTKAWFFGILSLLVLISSGVIIYNYKLRQKNLGLKLEQNQLEQKSKIDQLKSESQVRILNATLDGKETERKQIAETLHDSVSSLLSSANLHLQATRMQFNGNTPIEIDKTQKIIVEASQKIRDLSHTLVSSVLLKFGLKFAIKDMADKFTNSQIQIETDVKNVKRYEQNFEIKVHNIIQELVNNVLKHSNASKALVKIHDKEGLLFISIQDDGDGFDKNKIANKDGLGINQIEARIQMMKGKFNINSSSQTGTVIEIELPVQEKEVTANA